MPERSNNWYITGQQISKSNMQMIIYIYRVKFRGIIIRFRAECTYMIVNACLFYKCILKAAFCYLLSSVAEIVWVLRTETAKEKVRKYNQLYGCNSLWMLERGCARSCCLLLVTYFCFVPSNDGLIIHIHLESRP